MRNLSRPIPFALTSVPFFLLFLACLIDPSLTAPLTGHRLSFLADLVFLNNIHVCFSLFLYFKIDEFRDVYQGLNLKLIVGAIGLVVLVTTVLGWIGPALAVAALAHAFLQGIGIYLLFFCPYGSRRFVKYASWTMLALILARYFTGPFPAAVAWALAAASFVVFAAISRNWLGALFAFRFFLWFSPLESSQPSIAALHGIEYLLIVAGLMAEKKVRFTRGDRLLASLPVALMAAYTVLRYVERTTLALDIAVFFVVVLHYAFDSYAFRFQFARQRALILPLFRPMAKAEAAIKPRTRVG